MLQQLPSNPALSGKLHRYEMGDCQSFSSDCRCAAVVLSGSIEILLPSLVDRDARFCWQTLSSGDLIYPSRDIAGDNFPVFWIRGLTPSSVFFCGDIELRTLLLTDRYLASEFLEVQRRRVAELRRDSMRLRMQTAESRFMHFLQSENQFDADGQTLLAGYFHEIAMRLNLAPATLSRTLADLQRKGHFKRKGRRVSVRPSIQSAQESPRAQAAICAG